MHGTLAGAPQHETDLTMANNPASAPSLLCVTALKKNYGDSTALDGIDFSLAPGEFLTLLGPSGSGKTTTLMAIAGFVRPTSGDILHRGKSIIKTLPEDRGFGMVFQGYALFPHMTVEQNVRFPLAIRGIRSSKSSQQARQALEQVQLDSYAKRYPKQLSGGQQQRVALARALVYQPEILLLDEPLSALDKKLRGDLQWELRKLNKESGTSFLYVTHDQEEALSMSDRIAIFDQGKVVQIGTPSHLYEHPANLFVAGFLGKSNVLDACILGPDADNLAIRYEGGIISVPRPQAAVASTGQASLVIRPHKLKILPPGQGGLQAKVQAISYVGNALHYLVRTSAGTTLVVEQMAGPEGHSPLHGSDISLQFETNAVTVLEARPTIQKRPDGAPESQS
jgi:putative spermidine/putrescine transport system ATP-binding protein